MEDRKTTRLLGQEPAAAVLAADSEASPALDRASLPYIGQWNRLVSTTNWEKGRIISRWRGALIGDNAPAGEYSDDAWARRVGGLTGQHVGRLRRVFDRFGKVYEDYAGLYWSHFHAALDWDDAEMWLEGAVQANWSVAQMRRQRWEAMGALAAEQPRDEEIVQAETDDDFQPADEHEDPAARRGQAPAAPDEAQPLGGAGPGSPLAGGVAAADEAAITDESPAEAIQFVRPFENLGELPEDLAEAFEQFKLALLRHKTDGWSQISRDDVLAALDALKTLALAPSLD